MAQNWWESAPLANDPSFTGYIPGVLKPKEPKAPVFVPQGATTMMMPDGSIVPVPKVPGEEDPLKGAIDALGTPELLSSIKRAHENLKTGWATGTWGALAELKPGGGTPRDDFLANIGGIKGALIQDKLLALKQASKTGASGMGALSEKEGDLLASSVAALTPDMSPQEYERSFRDIANHALSLQAVRDGKDPRSPDVQKDIKAQIDGMFPPTDTTAPGGATDPKGGGSGGLTTPAEAATPSSGNDDERAKLGVGEFTADQKKAYANFWQQNENPSPDDLKSFLSTIGVNNVTNADQIIKAAKEGRGYSTQRIETDYRTKVEQKVKQQRELGGDENPSSLLFKQGAMLNLGDEASGVGNALANVVTSPFTGTFDPVTSYRVGRDAERLRIQNARDQLGYGGTALEVGGSLASMGPGALSLIAPKEAAATAGKAGAIGGALAGFGAGEGGRDSVTQATGGALTGYALGRYGPAVLGQAGKLLPKRFRPPQGMAPEVADAAQAEGVDLIRPMVDPNAVSDFGALESNIYSQPIIRGAQGRITGQIEDRVTALGGDRTPLDTGTAGDVVQTAGNRFIQRSRGIKNRLYDRAENLGGNAPVQGKEALGQIDQEIAQLNEAPDTNAAEIGFLEKLKADLSRPQTVGSIRRIRTSLRGQINQANLTATSAEARAMRVLDAARADIERDAPPAAAAAYARADAFNRERQTHIDTVIRQFLGKRDAPLDSEKAFAKLKSLASPGGGGRNLAAMMRNLEPDERQDIAATIAHSLGRRGPDEPFSTALFVSQARKLSPSSRRTIFGPDGAESISNLVLLSRKLEEAGKDINRSRSATVLERQGLRMAARSFIATLAGMGGTAAMTGSAGVGVAGGAAAGGAMMASAARRVLSARAMVNPRVSRWLAEAADVSTQRQAKEATRKLGVIIAREPALAQELQPIYQSLQQRLTMPLAADSGSERNQDEE